MRYYFYRIEGCFFCGRMDGHWHNVDPIPVTLDDEPIPATNVPGPFVTFTLQSEWVNAPLEDVLGVPEPAPIFQPGSSRIVWPTLYAYMKKRVERGLEKYGQKLSTHDGRDGLHDALDEAVDLCFYLMKVMLEAQDKRIHEYEGLRGGVESGY